MGDDARAALLGVVEELEQRARRTGHAADGPHFAGHAHGFEDAARLLRDRAAAYTGGWVSVRERLPERDEEVLFILRDGRRRLGHYRHGLGVWSGGRWDYPDSEVIHWHALPDPPAPTADPQPEAAACAAAYTGGWVSVRERLPEPCQVVQIGKAGESASLGYLIGKLHGWRRYSSNADPGEVTHWAPLLDPPAPTADPQPEAATP